MYFQISHNRITIRSDYSSHVKLQILLIHRFQLIEHAFLVTSMDSKYRKHLKKKKKKEIKCTKCTFLLFKIIDVGALQLVSEFLVIELSVHR